ncbi:MAG: LacI family DNA-binding transcriptional regulator [Chloroflexi bacterium]|nr:LacI family DNA-binding transcriptional regulator [Chloroflexota bacterium]
MKKLTLEEVGKLAGVSRATVSRVVNGYPHIRPEIRERVQRVIDETGYRPNLLARSLASDRSNIIGLVIPSGAQAVFTDPYFPCLTQGISRGVNSNNLTLALFMVHSAKEEERTILSILGTGLIDGLIVTSDNKGDVFIPELLKHEMPFVQIGRSLYSDKIYRVDTDNIAGSYMATQHLISLGYQRIATIATNRNCSGDDRFTGYCSAFADHGKVVDRKLVVYGDYTVDSGYHAMKQLIPQRPDAVFITSDTMALGGMRALQEANLRVPDDIAVVGYDDLPPAVQANPQLTTVRQPIEQTGFLAVSMLVKILSGDDPPSHQIVLPVELVVRASCGATRLKSTSHPIQEDTYQAN